MGEVRENRRWHGCKSMDIVVHRKAKTQGIRVLRGKRLRTRGAWKGEEEGRGDGGHLHCAVYFSPKSSITSRLNNPHPKNFIMSIATKPINIIRKYRLTSRYIPANPCS